MNFPKNKVLNTVVAVAIAAAMFVTANASTSARSSQRSLKTLHRYGWINPTLKLASSLDPAFISSANDYNAQYLVNRGLVIIGSDDQVHKDMASSIKVSGGSKVYTFTLKKGLKFADGHSIRARDFVFAIKRANAHASASQVASYDADIAGWKGFNDGTSNSFGVRAIGSNKVEVRTAKPIAYFLKEFTYPINNVVEASAVAGHPATRRNNFLTSTCPAFRKMATGPFVFKCSGSGYFPSGQSPRYSLVPNKRFKGYGHVPHINLTISSEGRTETAYAKYLRGQLDTTGIPSANLSGWRSSPRGQFHTQGTSTIGYISLNFHKAPFNNRNCRLAAAYAIDRKALAKILHGAIKPLYFLLPPGFPGYSHIKGVPTYNLKKAKSYIKKCPSRHTSFNYVYPTGSADADNSAGATVNMLRKAGFDHATQKGTDQNDWLNRVSGGYNSMTKGGDTALSNGWAQDYPDPQDYITLLHQTGSDYNIGGFSNKKFDQLARKADATFSAFARRKLYAQAQKVALNQGEPIMTDVATFNYLIKAHVHGLGLYVAWSTAVPKNLDWSKVKI